MRRRGVLDIIFLAWRTDRLRTVGAAVLAVAEGAAKGANALVLKLVADAVVAGSSERAFLAVVAAALLGGAWYASDSFGGMIRAGLRERVDVEIDARLLNDTLRLPGLAHHESPAYADELRLLSERRDDLVDVLPATARIVFATALATSVVSLLITLDGRLIILPVLGLAIVGATFAGERRWERMHAGLAQPWRQADHLWELATSPANIKELLVFGALPELRHRLATARAAIQRRMDTEGVIVTAAATFGWTVFASGFAAGIAIVAADVSGDATVGDLVLAIGLASQVSDHVATGADILARFFRASRAAARLAWLGEQHTHAAQPQAPARGTAVPTRVASGIRLLDVTFRYPGTTATVLDHVDLHLPAGATTALVGENGTGKSTIAKLLLRYYDPTDGAVLVDDTDLREFDPARWRRLTTAAFQDAVPFEFRAGDTIALGRTDRAEDLGHAVDASGCDRLVDALRDKLDTRLGRSFPDGVELSGGQWQHLALARAAIHREPLLLVLDEPASALDPSAEHELLRRAHLATRHTADRGGITLLVSHRLTTVRFADLICVLDAGRVVELGTHDELIARNGRYAELFRVQASNYR